MCCVISCHKWIREDFKSWSRDEIISYFSVEEEMDALSADDVLAGAVIEHDGEEKIA
jgi:hypothetical protein